MNSVKLGTKFHLPRFKACWHNDKCSVQTSGAINILIWKFSSNASVQTGTNICMWSMQHILFQIYIFQIYLTAIKTSQPIRICAFVYMPRSAVITACLPNRKLHNALFTEREFCFFSKHHLMLNSETEYVFSLSAVLYALAWTWTCTCEKDRFFCAECLCWCEQAFTHLHKS